MGPIVAGFLVGSLGYAATFDVLAALTLAATAVLLIAVQEPRGPTASGDGRRH
jgi:hypothetical protein